MHEKKERKYTALKVVGAAALTGAAVYGGTGFFLFRNIFDLQHSTFYTPTRGIKKLPQTNKEKSEWFAHSSKEDEFLDSYDGLKLHALKIMNHEDSHKWMILYHGIGGTSLSMLDYVYEADYRGFNVLAVDSRACGMSEGQFTGLGWCEHYDLISWINYLVNLDHEAEIALFGIDIGANAVMNAVGDYIPSNVKVAVEDSGFSGIRQIVRHGIQKSLKVDGRALLPSVDFFVKQFLHFSMFDVSTKRQLKNSTTPMLFMHGNEDEVIPVSMVFDNYYACGAAKELYTVEDAGFHETSLQSDYYEAIFSFIKNYISF